MVWEIERIEWSKLQADWNPNLISGAIAALQTASSDDEAETAYRKIDYNVVVDGLLFEAAVPTVTCLLGALQRCTSFGRFRILDILDEICREQLYPSDKVSAPDNLRLRELCLRELLRGVATLFDSLENGDWKERSIAVDLLGICCTVDEPLKDRVRWHFHKLLSQEMEDGVRGLTTSWLEELK